MNGGKIREKYYKLTQIKNDLQKLSRIKTNFQIFGVQDTRIGRLVFPVGIILSVPATRLKGEVYVKIR